MYGSTRHFNLKENVMLRNMITSALRPLTARIATLLDRLINEASPQFEFTVPPAASPMVHTAEPAPEETTATLIVTPVDKLEPTAPPSFDITTTTMPESPPVKPIAVCERPARQCRNRRHPKTKIQCTNKVWLENRSGLCDDCVHPCKGGCRRVIPDWHEYCPRCIPATKPCKGCGTEIAFEEPNYCPDCGHQCSGSGCTAVIPRYFEFCMADACQDEKWVKEHQPKQSSVGTSLGAKAHAARKAARAARDREAARGGRGPKKG